MGLYLGVLIRVVFFLAFLCFGVGVWGGASSNRHPGRYSHVITPCLFPLRLSLPNTVKLETLMLHVGCFQRVSEKRSAMPYTTDANFRRRGFV